MPWHVKAMKDATTSDIPRLGGSSLRSEGFRMGQPCSGNAEQSISESIGYVKRTWGTETSKYPEERISTDTPLVVASERGPAKP